MSVIVPNYNHAAFLEERLQSIFSQTYDSIEIILLDDHSADESDTILKKYSNHPKVRSYERNNANSGSPFSQWNKGIKRSTGKYVWVAESDDSCDPFFLETLVNLLEGDASLSMAYTQSYKIDPKGRKEGTWLFYTNGLNQQPFNTGFNMDGSKFIEEYLVYKNVIPNVSAVLFRKESLNSIFPLETNDIFRYNADWYYYHQLLCNGRIAFCPRPLNYFRYHSSSMIARAQQNQKVKKVFEKELKGRRMIINYLIRCNPPNIIAIQRQWRRSWKDHIAFYYLNCLKNKQWSSFLKFVTLEPILALKCFYKNFLQP